MIKVNKGQVWWIAGTSLDQDKATPHLIISMETDGKFNAVPIKLHADGSDHSVVYYKAKGKDQYIICNDIRTFSVASTTNYMYYLSKDIMDQVDEALLYRLCINRPNTNLLNDIEGLFKKYMNNSSDTIEEEESCIKETESAVHDTTTETVEVISSNKKEDTPKEDLTPFRKPFLAWTEQDKDDYIAFCNTHNARDIMLKYGSKSYIARIENERSISIDDKIEEEDESTEVCPKRTYIKWTSDITKEFEEFYLENGLKKTAEKYNLSERTVTNKLYEINAITLKKIKDINWSIEKMTSFINDWDSIGPKATSEKYSLDSTIVGLTYVSKFRPIIKNFKSKEEVYNITNIVWTIDKMLEFLKDRELLDTEDIMRKYGFTNRQTIYDYTYRFNRTIAKYKENQNDLQRRDIKTLQLQ